MAKVVYLPASGLLLAFEAKILYTDDSMVLGQLCQMAWPGR